MKEGHRKYTAFPTRQGHFEYKRMPCGFNNAPVKFQRIMDNAFRGLIEKNYFVYCLSNNITEINNCFGRN